MILGCRELLWQGLHGCVYNDPCLTKHPTVISTFIRLLCIFASIGKNMHDQIHHPLPDGLPFPVHACKIFQAFFSVAKARALMMSSSGARTDRPFQPNTCHILRNTMGRMSVLSSPFSISLSESCMMVRCSKPETSREMPTKPNLDFLPL